MAWAALADGVSAGRSSQPQHSTNHSEAAGATREIAVLIGRLPFTVWTYLTHEEREVYGGAVQTVQSHGQRSKVPPRSIRLEKEAKPRGAEGEEARLRGAL